MRAHLITSILAAVLVGGLAACSGATQPSAADSPARTPTSTATPTGANADTAVPRENLPMPELIGGNVSRAVEQMGPDTQVRISDAAGEHRPIEDPSVWKICTAVRNPEQVVLLGAVMTDERC
ncbi:hypothetical protein [Actinacidiphila sp. bgisy167]|uniref:hypothetical protein n=1 Tax=Actinacidiphila sp. bgisy167 TaxID=3413797 RepID=UPI003D753107